MNNFHGCSKPQNKKEAIALSIEHTRYNKF